MGLLTCIKKGNNMQATTVHEQTKRSKPGFFKNLKAEFRKIIFPSRENVAKQTVLIIVCVIVLSILIKLADTGIQALIALIS